MGFVFALRVFLSKQLCTLIGGVLPILASAKAAVQVSTRCCPCGPWHVIIGPDTVTILGVQEDVEGFEQWTTYWIVVTILSVLQLVTDVVFAPWFPFYYELKVLL